MNLTILIFGGLIVWRVADIFVKQKGPLDIFVRFRAHLASRQKRMGGWYDMFSCMACVTMMAGAIMALAFANGLLQWIGYTLALSAIATLIERFSGSKS